MRATGWPSPKRPAASVEANLRALLLLALDLDGGRYPSLPRFIDELRELRDADVNDAPDEGEIAMQSADTGRVRILTIHGAKGLEAPIVWLLGANAAPRAADAWDVLVDWPPEAPAPQHFSFFGRKEDHGAARQLLFDAETTAARREELNLLYVALTRARQLFIASGTENAKSGGKTPYLPVGSRAGETGRCHGDMEKACRMREAMPLEAPLDAVSKPCLPLPAVGERRQAPDAAERFGILLHALLERRTEGTEKAANDRRWTAWLKENGFSEGDYRRAFPVAERVLGAPDLQRFFDSGAASPRVERDRTDDGRRPSATSRPLGGI